MQLLSIYIAFLALLAGRVCALNISVPGMGNLTQTQFLTVADPTLNSACGTQCTNATSQLSACADDACVCSNTTAAAVQLCEQCMFTALIAANKPMPDVRAGNQVVLTNYFTACTAVNPVLPTALSALALPPDWDGPFGQGLTPFTTAVFFVASLLVGGGAIAVVNTM